MATDEVPPTVPASAVNRDAGAYRITADPAEQAAARAASDASWREFPYYEHRYGERGWRFTFSDSGWIAALCALPPEAATGQLRWLQVLLVARGMPSYLVERHLALLCEEFASALPAQADRYGVLREFVATLAAERRALLSDAALARLAGQFDAAVRALPGAIVGMGAVLVSVVVDEAQNRPNAVESLLDWACDPARFAPAWIAEVRLALERARRAIEPPGGDATSQ